MNEREQRLADINRQLAERQLKPIRKLGDHTRGEFEVVAIKEIYDHSKKYFTDVKFDVLLPNGDGRHGEFTVRFNADGEVSDGAVIVTVINGRFAIVKQWRLPLAVWTYEVPRGFGDKVDKAKVQDKLGTLKIGDLPLGTVVRELGEEVMKDAVITSVTHLGNIAENSGTSAIAPSYWLVQIQTDESKLAEKLGGSEDAMKVYLWDADKVHSEIGGKLADNHTITAITLARKHIEALPRLKPANG